MRPLCGGLRRYRGEFSLRSMKQVATCRASWACALGCSDMSAVAGVSLFRYHEAWDDVPEYRAIRRKHSKSCFRHRAMACLRSLPCACVLRWDLWVSKERPGRKKR